MDDTDRPPCGHERGAVSKEMLQQIAVAVATIVGGRVDFVVVLLRDVSEDHLHLSLAASLPPPVVPRVLSVAALTALDNQDEATDAADLPFGPS